VADGSWQVAYDVNSEGYGEVIRMADREWPFFRDAGAIVSKD